MAGFDFHFHKHPAGAALQRLLRWIQTTARDMELRFRFRSEGSEYWSVLDGPGGEAGGGVPTKASEG